MSDTMVENKRAWMSSMTAKIAGSAALLAGVAGVINGAIDVYKAIAGIPTNKHDAVNQESFRRNFDKEALVAQPVKVSQANVTVEMMLKVYPTGDVYVAYGDIQQWLPFKPPLQAPKPSVGFLISQALAQQSSSGAPVAKTTEQRPIVIDIDEIIRRNAVSEGRSASRSIERTYLVAEMKTDHPFAFSSSRKQYEKTFHAQPGYKIVQHRFLVESQNKAHVDDVKVSKDGKSVRIVYTLKSGSVIKGDSGWLKGVVETTQQRIDP